MKKSKIILMLITMFLTIVLSVYITFAWFDMIRSSKPIIINTGSLKQSSSFFYGVDLNKNGIIEESEYEGVSEGGISLFGVLPGEVNYFRIRAKNLGNIDGNLTIIMNDMIISNRDILEGFYVEYTYNDEVIHIDLSEATGDESLSLVLIENVTLSPEEQFFLDFKMIVKPEHNSSWGGEELRITNYIIRMVQVY